MAASSAELDQHVQAVAEKALTVTTQDQNWIVKLIAFGLVLFNVWWLKKQIQEKDKELHEIKAKIEKQAVDAQAAADKAKIDGLAAEVARLEAIARAKAENARRALEGVATLQAANAARMEKVKKISNWEDLNRLAQGR